MDFFHTRSAKVINSDYNSLFSFSNFKGLSFPANFKSIEYINLKDFNSILSFLIRNFFSNDFITNKDIEDIIQSYLDFFPNNDKFYEIKNRKLYNLANGPTFSYTDHGIIFSNIILKNVLQKQNIKNINIFDFSISNNNLISLLALPHDSRFNQNIYGLISNDLTHFEKKILNKSEHYYKILNIKSNFEDTNNLINKFYSNAAFFDIKNFYNLNSISFPYLLIYVAHFFYLFSLNNYQKISIILPDYDPIFITAIELSKLLGLKIDMIYIENSSNIISRMIEKKTISFHENINLIDKIFADELIYFNYERLFYILFNFSDEKCKDVYYSALNQKNYLINDNIFLNLKNKFNLIENKINNKNIDYEIFLEYNKNKNILHKSSAITIQSMNLIDKNSCFGLKTFDYRKNLEYYLDLLNFEEMANSLELNPNNKSKFLKINNTDYQELASILLSDDNF